jgi:hypothetical protein
LNVQWARLGGAFIVPAFSSIEALKINLHQNGISSPSSAVTVPLFRAQVFPESEAVAAKLFWVAVDVKLLFGFEGLVAPPTGGDFIK